ncbi:MAG: hypothetical protein ACPLZY_03875, partial [Candidatus Norongarragalinales archaeon]
GHLRTASAFTAKPQKQRTRSLLKQGNGESGSLQERLDENLNHWLFFLTGRPEPPSYSCKKYVFKPSGRVQWIFAGNSRDYLIYEVAPYCTAKFSTCT